MRSVNVHIEEITLPRSLRAFEFLRQAGGGGQRVERVAGDDRVEADPDQRRRGDDRRAASRACALLVPGPAPQPVGAAQHPRVRAQQARRAPGARAPRRRGAGAAPRARSPTRSARCRRCPGSPGRRGSRRRSGSAAAAPRSRPRPVRSTAARAGRARRRRRRTRRSTPSTISRAPPSPKIEQNAPKAIASGCSVGPR